MDISIRIMDEYTRFCVAICINMEIVSSSSDTSANKFPIVLEIHGEDSRAMFHVTDLSYTVLYINTLLRIQKQINRCCISNRHVMEIQSITTSFFHKHIDKFFTCNTLVVRTCVADRCTEYKTMFFQKIHGMHNFIIYTGSTTHIIDIRFTLNA